LSDPYRHAGRTFFRATVVAASLAVSIAVAAVTAARAETLEEALTKAYENNPTLLAARARLRATDEGVSQALSGWRPTVSLSYDVGKDYTSTNGSSRTSRNSTPRGGGLSLDQNVYEGGKTVATTARAEQEVLAERARLASTEQDIMLRAATAYTNVLRDQAVLRLTQSNERVLQRQLEATRDRFQVGEVTRTDVAQAESRLSRSTSERIAAEGELAKSRADYRDVVGDFPGTLQPARPAVDIPASQDGASEQARSGNPAVISARFNERAAAAGIRVARADLLPTVDIEGDLSRDHDVSSTVERSDGASIVATLSVPLYQAGAVSSRIREARQIHSQRLRELDAAVRSAVATATQAWESYQTARAQISAFDAEVRAASIALEGVRQEAQVGSRTVLDVLDAEQELLNARVSLVRARRDEVVTSFDVRRSIGTLLATRLNLPVTAYDFESYYRSVRNKWWGWETGRE